MKRIMTLRNTSDGVVIRSTGLLLTAYGMLMDGFLKNDPTIARFGAMHIFCLNYLNIYEDEETNDVLATIVCAKNNVSNPKKWDKLPAFVDFVNARMREVVIISNSTKPSEELFNMSTEEVDAMREELEDFIQNQEDTR